MNFAVGSQPSDSKSLLPREREKKAKEKGRYFSEVAVNP